MKRHGPYIRFALVFFATNICALSTFSLVAQAETTIVPPKKLKVCEQKKVAPGKLSAYYISGANIPQSVLDLDGDGGVSRKERAAILLNINRYDGWNVSGDLRQKADDINRLKVCS